jgi:GT2 family glycosyltransferase
MLSFNNIDIIGQCLTALSKSTHTNLETIILECASKDGSPSYLEKNFPWVKLFKFKKDPGPDLAYTYGFRQAKGDYVLMLSADVLVLPNTIQELVNHMVTDSLDISAPSCLDWDGAYTNSGLGWNYFTVHEYDLIAFSLQKVFRLTANERPFFFIFPCCLVRKATYLKIPLNQNIEIYEDVEWSWRLNLKGAKIKVFDEIYCLHQVGASIKGLRSYYYNARSQFATIIICAKTGELLFVLPSLMLTNFLNFWFEIFNFRFKKAQSMVKGWGDFLKLLPVFLNDRKVLSPNDKNNSFNFIERYLEGENYEKKRNHLKGKIISFNH